MNKLLENSKVQITTAVIVGVFVVGVIAADTTWKINLGRDVREIREELRARTFDRWPRQDMETWVLRTERLNQHNGWQGADVDKISTNYRRTP